MTHTTDMQTGQPMPAFDLLLGELQRSCGLSEWQAIQMRQAFRGYAGQVVQVPAERTWKRAESVAIALRLLDGGASRSEVTARIVMRGHSQTTAQEIALDAIRQRGEQHDRIRP